MEDQEIPTVSITNNSAVNFCVIDVTTIDGKAVERPYDVEAGSTVTFVLGANQSLKVSVA